MLRCISVNVRCIIVNVSSMWKRGRKILSLKNLQSFCKKSTNGWWDYIAILQSCLQNTPLRPSLGSTQRNSCDWYIFYFLCVWEACATSFGGNAKSRMVGFSSKSRVTGLWKWQANWEEGSRSADVLAWICKVSAAVYFGTSKRSLSYYIFFSSWYFFPLLFFKRSVNSVWGKNPVTYS